MSTAHCGPLWLYRYEKCQAPERNAFFLLGVSEFGECANQAKTFSEQLLFSTSDTAVIFADVCCYLGYCNLIYIYIYIYNIYIYIYNIAVMEISVPLEIPSNGQKRLSRLLPAAQGSRLPSPVASLRSHPLRPLTTQQT